jgi:hypothetical protein
MNHDNAASTSHNLQLQVLMTASVIQLHSVEAQLPGLQWVEGF